MSLKLFFVGIIASCILFGSTAYCPPKEDLKAQKDQKYQSTNQKDGKNTSQQSEVVLQVIKPVHTHAQLAQEFNKNIILTSQQREQLLNMGRNSDMVVLIQEQVIQGDQSVADQIVLNPDFVGILENPDNYGLKIFGRRLFGIESLRNTRLTFGVLLGIGVVTWASVMTALWHQQN